MWRPYPIVLTGIGALGERPEFSGAWCDISAPEVMPAGSCVFVDTGVTYGTHGTVICVQRTFERSGIFPVFPHDTITP